MIWLNLDLNNWDEDDYRVELIASCAVSIENVTPGTEQSYQIEQGRLTAIYDNWSNDVEKTLTYDSAKPEKGWEIHSRPVTPPK
ncbi:MAG: hypothetical protein WBX03_19825 [Terriglobales bacterium]